MSLLSPVKAQELNINEYVASIGLNPSNVYYARYSSTNVSPQQAQWSIQSPNRRNVLLSYAQVEWEVKYKKEREATAGAFDYDGVETKWENEAPLVSFKGPFPFANCMSACTVSLNGTTQTISQPRNFWQQVCTMCVNYEEARKCYESGYWEAAGGIWPTVAGVGNRGKALEIDKGLMENEDSWALKALEGANETHFRNTWPVANGSVMTYTEPLIFSPFNPFAKVMTMIPNYLPWKKMSHVIPNIDRLEIDIQFQKMSASLWLQRYLKSTNAQGDRRHKLTVLDLEADLLLYWYEFPTQMELSRSVNLQNWMVREFSTNSAIGALRDRSNGAAGIANQDSQLIQLRSIPTFVILSCLRDKDEGTYAGDCYSADDDGDGGNGAVSARNTVDYYAKFTKVEVILSDRPMVISSTFSQAELYYLTVKNSKYPYPYSQMEWAGKRVPVYAVGAGDVVSTLTGNAAYRRQISRMAPIFRPKDLSEKLSDGIFAPTTLQFRTTVEGHHGISGTLNDVAHAFRLYVHVFDGKSFLLMEPDRSQFQLQSVSLEAARAATQPAADVGSGLKVGGAFGGLGALRSRAGGAERYVPRVF